MISDKNSSKGNLKFKSVSLNLVKFVNVLTMAFLVAKYGKLNQTSFTAVTTVCWEDNDRASRVHSGNLWEGLR